MAEELKTTENQEQVEESTAPEGSEVEQQEVENTDLPSDKQDEAQMIKDWDTLVESDPNYMKQFKSLEDFKEKYKELHKVYSNTIRQQKEAEKKTQETQEKEVKQQEVVMDLVPQFLENNMQLTPEMEQQLTEQGLDIRDVKLGAIELKERVSKAHDTVGGKEEYESMISWAKENLSEEQRNAFDKDVTGNMSEFAIRGLHNMYKENTAGETRAPDRLRGQSTSSGVQPYQSKEEVLRDRAYINSARGRMDAKAREKHNARLNVTPDSVIF